MTSSGFHTLQVADVRSQTANGVGVSFAIPEALRRDFEFVPGQYLTVRRFDDGEEVRRCYSVCSSLTEKAENNIIEIGVKHLKDGLFSSYAMALKPGDQLEVMPPQGRFNAEVGGQHNYLLVASGSGITPCLSIAKSVLAEEPTSRIHILYGNRNTSTAMFKDDLDALKDAHTDRCQITWVMSRELQDVEFLNGRLDTNMLETLTDRKIIAPSRYDSVFICGPQEMAEDAKKFFELAGSNNVQTELFTTAESKRTVVLPAELSSQVKEVGALVTIIHDGVKREIFVDAKSDTVLSAARKAGIDLPFSCAGGMCCTCRCKVVSGKTSMDLNYSLQDWETEAGFTLACQTRPLSEDVVLDFDFS